MKLRLVSLAALLALPLPPEPAIPGNPFRPLPPPNPRNLREQWSALHPSDRAPGSRMPGWYRPAALSWEPPENQPAYLPAEPVFLPALQESKAEPAPLSLMSARGRMVPYRESLLA